MPRSGLARHWRGAHVSPEARPEAGARGKLAHVIGTGASESAPWLLFAATMLVIAVAAATIMALSFLGYYLA
jgi:hypothetical protein